MYSVYKIAPRLMLNASLLLAGILILIAVILSLQERSLGIQWEASDDHKHLQVAGFIKNGSASHAGVQIGMVFTDIGDGHQTEKLTPESIVEEPDELLDYAAYQKFLHHQTQLASILSSPNITLTDISNAQITLSPRAREIYSLPFEFWFQLTCGALAVLAGFAVFAFKQRSEASQIYLLNGLSFALVTFAAAVYSSRELAIPGHLFQILSSMNHLGSILFAVTFVGLSLYIPSKMVSSRSIRLLIILAVLLFVGDACQWLVNSSEIWIFVPIIVALLSSFVIAFLQWRKSKGNPVDRAALKWLMFALFLPGSIFVGFIIVFQWLKIELIVSQAYSFGFILLMYIGISFGVTRYALFQLDQWWRYVWLWLIGGLVFIGMDMVFISWLSWNESLSNLISLSVVGFVYFPIRQWVLSKFFSHKQGVLESLLPDVLQLVSMAGEAKQLSKAWETLLQKAFTPMSLVTTTQFDTKRVKIVENGMSLLVPNIGGDNVLMLSYPDQGHRLFSEKDIEFMSSLSQIIEKALLETQAYQRGMSDERLRMTEDLHDDLGGKLLSLVYRSENSDTKQLARDALNELREIMNANRMKDQTGVDVIQGWMQSCSARSLECGKTLRWHCSAQIPMDKLISSMVVFQGQKILSEALSNAIKHGEGNDICVQIRFNGKRIFIAMQNESSQFLSESHKYHYGLKNIRNRIQRIQSKVHCRHIQEKYYRIAWFIPLEL